MPDGDIDDYICGRWPHVCHRDYGDTMAPNHSPTTANPASTLVNRVPLWAALPRSSRFLPGGTPWSARRSPTSAPKSAPNARVISVWKTGCGSCHATAEQILMTIRKLNRTPQDDRLFGCEVAGVDLKTIVWFSPEKARPEANELPFLPNSCWRKALT